MKKGRFGFTLVEVLVGAVLMTIVIAGISFGISAALNLYEKAESQSVVINGLRFTVDSYNREVVPMLHTACSVDVLLSSDAEVDNVVINDPGEYYLYLKNKSLALKSQTGTEALPGSEYITKLLFNLPTSGTSSDQNLLNMHLTASHNEYESVVKSIDVKTALYNEPQKISGHVASGNVLHFYSRAEESDLTLSVSVDMYLGGTYRKINDTVALPNNLIIKASYDVAVRDSSNNIVEYTSKSAEYQWYVASTDDFDSVTPIKIEGAITDTFDASTLKNNSQYCFGNNTYLRCHVKAKAHIAGRDKPIEDNNPLRWSPYVAISNPLGVEKNMWQDWLGRKSGFIDTSMASVINRNNGVMTIRNLAGGSNRFNNDAATVALLDYNYMDNDKIYSVNQNFKKTHKNSNDIPSYMTPTNYSVIVDFKANSNNINAVRVFLSTTSGNAFFDSGNNTLASIGYALELKIPNNSKGFAVRCHQDITGASMWIDKEFGVENILDNVTFYNPWRLFNKNCLTLGWKETDRHRLLITVLEYYIDDNSKPRFIIRGRLLKEKSDDPAILIDDPWCIGPDFFLSEPMWFGLPVGATHFDNSAPVKHFAGDSGNNNHPSAVYTKQSTNTINKSDVLYGTKYTTSNTASDHGIFKLKELNLYNDINWLSQQYINNTNRKRYIGLGIDASNNDNNTYVSVYDMALAPGFSIDELKSIIPKDGKIYEISETIDSTRFNQIENSDWYRNTLEAQNMNNALFGGNYNGNKSKGDSTNVGNDDSVSRYYISRDATTIRFSKGIYGLQHVPGVNCECPLHNELYKWCGSYVDDYTPEMILSAFKTLVHSPGTETYDYLNKNQNGERSLDSDGINTADTIMREIKKMFGIDIMGSSWRIHRPKTGEKYNFYWTAQDITGTNKGDIVDDVYRLGEAADDNLVRRGKTTISTKNMSESGINYIIQYLNASNWVVQ